MKRAVLLTILLLCCLFAADTKAQTFSAWGKNPWNVAGGYDTIHFTGDTLVFTFSSVPTGAYGTARFVVYYEGDFSDTSEYLRTYGPGNTYLGRTDAQLTDCVPEDSTVQSITAGNINSWAPGITFKLVPTTAVDVFCTRNRARVRLEFDWCAFGTPVEFASLRPWSDSIVCAHRGTDTLIGTPRGGTFFGAIAGSWSDSIVNSWLLPPGFHTFTYTAEDSIGCITTDEFTLQVLPDPVVPDQQFCVGQQLLLTATGGVNFVWWADSMLTSALDTGATFLTDTLFETTTYWVSTLDSNHIRWSDSMVTANFLIRDHNTITGDDRGGIAVTQNYVYVMGDNSGVRYDANLSLASATAVPLRDGLFSDLRDGKLWSLWDTQTNSDPQAFSSTPFVTRAIRWSDSLLNFLNGYVYLSQPIVMGAYPARNGIFAGYGMVGIYSGYDGHFYVIDMDNGYVNDLGATTLNFYGSESWADWGLLEQNCDTTYAVVYRASNNANAITRQPVPSGTPSNVGVFPSGLNDMASITQSHWNNRWYFHHEGSSGTFGGTNETVGYADANGYKASCGAPVVCCPTPVTLWADSIVPSVQNICVVTVDSSTNWNRITWERHPSEQHGFYKIYKETTQAGVYALVRTQPVAHFTMWSDSMANAAQAADRYKMTITDTCGHESPMSAHHKTIHLTVNQGPNSTWNLIWSHYEGFNFLTYKIYRGFSPTALFLIDSIQSNLNSWTDLTPPGGTIYYAVKAVNPGTCSPSNLFTLPEFSSSFSNVYSPNAVNVDELALLDQSLSIAPNPGDGLFNLSFSGNSADVLVTVTDAVGRMVYSEKLGNVYGSHRSQLNLIDAAPGIYYAVLTTEKGKVMRKLIVSK